MSQEVWICANDYSLSAYLALLLSVAGIYQLEAHLSEFGRKSECFQFDHCISDRKVFLWSVFVVVYSVGIDWAALMSPL